MMVGSTLCHGQNHSSQTVSLDNNIRCQSSVLKLMQSDFKCDDALMLGCLSENALETQTETPPPSDVVNGILREKENLAMMTQVRTRIRRKLT